jgi:acyl-CoA synthetase (AMP-forming)/AMP-acid ligase II
VIPQFDTETVLRWLQSGRIQHAMLIPSMVISLLEHPKAHDSDYAGLRQIMYGGAPMAPAVIRQMVEVYGCDLFNGFGAGTEAAGQTMFRPADHRRALAGEEHLLGSIGKPIYGCDVKLCDADGNEVADGEVGEIYSRSNSVMTGYLGQPELSAQAVRDGWFHAGDLAWRDKDGYLFLAGRADDMIIRGGENVYPVEIEDVLSDHPSVLEVAVVGEPDDYWGEVVTAVVTLRAGTTFTLDELTEHCTGRLAKYKFPQRLVVVDELPKNQTGKIRKGVIRRSLAAGEVS